MNINEKCDLLKNKCIKLLQESNNKQVKIQEEYDSLCIKRRKKRTEEVEAAIDENITTSAKNFNNRFMYEDIVSLIEFLQDETASSYKEIEI
jgi:hypothetical protein